MTQKKIAIEGGKDRVLWLYPFYGKGDFMKPSKARRVLYTLIVILVAAAIIAGCFYLIENISQDMHGENQSSTMVSTQQG